MVGHASSRATAAAATSNIPAVTNAGAVADPEAINESSKAATIATNTASSRRTALAAARVVTVHIFGDGAVVFT